MKTSILLVFLFLISLNSYAIKSGESDSSISINSEGVLIEKLVESINEALYKTDNDLPEFGKATLIIRFVIDHEAKYKLISVEGSDKIINYQVKKKLEKSNFVVDDRLKNKKFVLPITYKKRPYEESYKKKK